MKVLLLHPETDARGERPEAWGFDTLVADVGLASVLEAMAGDDAVVGVAARDALAHPVTDVHTIRYRQAVVRDALRNPDDVKAMYDLATRTLADEREQYFGMRDNPSSILRRSVKVLELFAERLRELRRLAERMAPRFESDAFQQLFKSLQTELDDDYLARVDAHLSFLQFRDGELLSARLGPGNVGQEYELRAPNEPLGPWWQRLFASRSTSFGFTIAPRDDSGFRMLNEIRDRGLNLVANALAQSNDHILGFFKDLQSALAYSVAAINLHAALSAKGQPTCFPEVAPTSERRRTFDGLYDPALSLLTEEHVVGNELHADGKALIVITGANQGGKTTLLRSLGVAQVMMQAGLFVAARSASLSVCSGEFTHFKREEDTALRSGKLDEELTRMSTIVDHLGPGSLLLLNESFASTNEREGSEIARELTTTLIEHGVTVVFVTHLYDYASSMAERGAADTLFLRAERGEGGERSFKVREGAPLPTSFGMDVFAEVFGPDASSP